MEKYFYRVLSWVFKSINWVKDYVFWGEMRKKHILIQKNGGQIKIVVKDHVQFVVEKQMAIDEYAKKRNENACIENAFELAVDGCNMIFFDKDKYSLAFWIKGGRIQLDLTLGKKAGTMKYFYPVLGVLADMGFVRSDFVTSGLTMTNPPKYNKYKVDKTRGGVRICGFFERWTGGAADFTKTVFNEIYKAKKGEMKITVR